MYSTNSPYSLPLTEWDLEVENTNIVLHAKHINDLNKKEKKAQELHRQFAQVLKKKLLKLVEESKGFKDKEYFKCIQECSDNCQVCRKYQRSFQNPVVSMPVASQFNEVVCMDLKRHMHNRIWVLHLSDSAVRYSATYLVRTENKDEIIKQIYRIWFAYFRSPHLFLSNNGSEFSNDLFQKMNEKLNVEPRITTAESAVGYGMVERQ